MTAGARVHVAAGSLDPAVSRIGRRAATIFEERARVWCVP